jgi:threonine dehydrogenase-like Zn-dependent dehydrogenase
MRAILRKQFGGPEVLEIRDIPEPEPKAGHAVIQVKAFGINHAEKHMREGQWAEIADVSGIECVGVVKSCPGGEFAAGTKVGALMGGLGRTINGSYAEYTRAPVTNVAAIESNLPWAELAAIPEIGLWLGIARTGRLRLGETRAGSESDGGSCRHAGALHGSDEPASLRVASTIARMPLRIAVGSVDQAATTDARSASAGVASQFSQCSVGLF